MRFTPVVEAPEPMKGLEVPSEVVEALGAGKRPPIIITINGHAWRSRIAIMRGRNLVGFSNANRKAAGIATGDHVEVELELDLGSRVAVEPDDLRADLDAEPLARQAFDRLTESQKCQQVRTIDSAKMSETRVRRIRALISVLVDA